MRKTNLLGFGTFWNGADDYRCYRSYCYFDTSFLGDISIIHNVSLSYYVVPISYNKTFDFEVILQRGITNEYPHRPAENSDFNRDYYWNCLCYQTKRTCSFYTLYYFYFLFETNCFFYKAAIFIEFNLCIDYLWIYFLGA